MNEIVEIGSVSVNAQSRLVSNIEWMETHGLDGNVSKHQNYHTGFQYIVIWWDWTRLVECSCRFSSHQGITAICQMQPGIDSVNIQAQ